MSYRWLFAHLLHIPPWEIGRLTVEEFESAIAWIDAYQAEMAKEG